MGPLYALLVAAILHRPSAGSEATITATLPPQASSTAPSGLDSAQALNTQRHNLFLLFDRYGESNQSMTLDGFRKLCLNASRLLTVHGMDTHTLLGAHEFRFICPAIINQIDRVSCLSAAKSSHAAESSHGVYSKKKAWLGGFIAITIISVLSLLGIILIPLMNKVFFKFLLSFLVALAVGTLSGDAFLHLLPHWIQKMGMRKPLRHQRKYMQDLGEETAMSPRPYDLTSLIDRRKRRL
ncbi:unnamed protein product, partial [Ranitomeya imitator]